jgi:hypothetical protein
MALLMISVALSAFILVGFSDFFLVNLVASGFIFLGFVVILKTSTVLLYRISFSLVILALPLHFLSLFWAEYMFFVMFYLLLIAVLKDLMSSVLGDSLLKES